MKFAACHSAESPHSEFKAQSEFKVQLKAFLFRQAFQKPRRAMSAFTDNAYLNVCINAGMVSSSASVFRSTEKCALYNSHLLVVVVVLPVHDLANVQPTTVEDAMRKGKKVLLQGPVQLQLQRPDSKLRRSIAWTVNSEVADQFVCYRRFRCLLRCGVLKPPDDWVSSVRPIRV